MLTVTQPIAKLAGLSGLNIAVLEDVDKILDDGVHQGLHGQNGGHRVVAHHRALDLRMKGWVHLGEHVEHLLPVDDGAAVLVKVGLDPFSIGAVDDAVEIRDVEVQEVRSNPDDGAVLLMELFHSWGILARPDLPDAPQICPSCFNVSTVTLKGHRMTA